MKTILLKSILIILVFSACTRTLHPASQITGDHPYESTPSDQPNLDGYQQPLSLMDLPQSENGGFVLAPGFYEAEFKTYCLQPGTPDPSQGDAYFQSGLTGYRKDIIESVLVNSNNRPEIDQKNIQLLLWSTVSG